MTTEIDASSSDDKATLVRSVGNNDVLFGRGRRSYNHPGNESFRSFVAERALAYRANESKTYRRTAAAKVIAKVQKNDGLFLQPTETVNKDGQLERCWQIVPMPIVMTKVKQALRDMGAILSLKGSGEGNKKSITSYRTKATQVSRSVGGGALGATSQQLSGIRQSSTSSDWRPCGVSPTRQRQMQKFYLTKVIEEEMRKLHVLQLRRHQAVYSLALLDEHAVRCWSTFLRDRDPACPLSPCSSMKKI